MSEKIPLASGGGFKPEESKLTPEQKQALLESMNEFFSQIQPPAILLALLNDVER